MNSIMIHGVKRLTLSDIREIKSTGAYVRTLTIKHNEDVTTNIDLFANIPERLKVVQR